MDLPFSENNASSKPTIFKLKNASFIVMVFYAVLFLPENSLHSQRSVIVASGS